MSTISGVSGASNPWAALNSQRSQHQAKMFAKVDADSSGGVDQTELSTMLADISEKTGVSLGDSKELFTQMDSNSDGSLSSDELGEGMKSLMPPPPSTMVFAQSRSAGGSGGNQDDLFAKVDTNSDGSLDADELKVLTAKIQSDTGQDVSTQFSKLDTDGDSKLSQTEFEAGRPQAAQSAGDAQGAQGAVGPKGPPPAGGPGGAQGASKQDTTYDELDTNQDGTVSELERLVGELQNASASDDTGNTTTKLDLASLAREIYAQVAQGLSGNHSALLNVSA